jgi:hypothetical protein
MGQTGKNLLRGSVLIGPYGFLRALYDLINSVKIIIPFVTKRYGPITALLVFEFGGGGCTEAEG